MEKKVYQKPVSTVIDLKENICDFIPTSDGEAPMDVKGDIWDLDEGSIWNLDKEQDW